MNRKRLLSLTFILTATLLFASCTLPRVRVVEATSTPEPATPTIESLPLQPTAELGLVENPLILTLPPSANTAPEQIDAAKLLAEQLTRHTGYAVVTAIPDSYASLIDAFSKGNAHIAVLSPYAYVLARQENLGEAVFASLKNGGGKYGAQFLAHRDAGFTSYLDIASGTNNAEADVALAQFTGKKPCWTDETSASGYVVPAGILAKYEVPTKPAAFLGGHPPVVRALYSGGICDFGATYIDARKSPSLEDQFPDLMEQVIVIWRIPPIIPHEVLVFSTAMPPSMRAALVNSIPAIMQTTAGKEAFQTVYQIEELQPVTDGYYNDFRTYVEASGIDIEALLR